MEKAPDAYRTISEVAEDLDLPQHVLRFWETRFGQIKPLKRGGGRRYYRPDDVELLKGIRHLLYKEGYTIKGVQRILKEHGIKAVQAVTRSQAPADWAPEERMPFPAGAEISNPGSPYQPADMPAPAPLGVDHEIARATYPGASFPGASSVPGHGDRAGAEVLAGEDSGEQGPEQVPVDGATIGPSPVLAGPERPAPSPAARGQVAMFRGALQRGETGMGAGSSIASPLEFASRLQGRASLQDGAPARDHLVSALEDLVAARSAIDRLIQRRAG